MAENTKMNKMIGERIRAARKAKGLSQLELGDRLDVSFQAVSTWEQGKFIPDPAHLTALSGELDLSLDRLFAEEGNRWELKPVNFDADHMFTFVKTRAQDLGLTQTLQVMPLLRIALRQYPQMIHALDQRHLMYNRQLAYVAEAERAGRCLVIRPDAPIPIGHISHDPRQMRRVYDLGREVGQRYIHQIQAFYHRNP